ncbi:UNVERIFIED_CONTAM: protein MKS1 [Sesamum latifolium]|uniref:Protein MKS1 n=1 Tax=Sesamum latifolium TaxID=2727402 RepID=A0AAW2XA07_9LAMI
MNPPEFFSGGGDDATGSPNRPSPRKELQGPRPTALKVNKDSYKIRKPPVAPPPHNNPPPSDAHAHGPPQGAEDRKPVIIYSVSPKVIHTTVSDFMNLVQRLTGNSADDGASSSAAGPGDISPAARLASIEKTSPAKDREITANIFTDNNNNNSNFMGDLLETSTDVELGRVPGILSPAPGSLQPISPGFFSPTPDPFMMGYNMFIPSPSTLFSAPMVSPSPSSSSCDLFNPFFDF